MDTQSWVWTGAVVESCMYSALFDWRQDYAPGKPVADLFANHVAEVETTFTQRPGGRAECLVQVRGRRGSPSEAFFYKLRRIAGEWTQVD